MEIQTAIPTPEILPLNPKIAELSQKASIAEKSAVDLMEPGQKKKRGRPPGTKKSASDTPQKSSMHSFSSVDAPNATSTAANSISSARLAEPFVKLVSKAGAGYVGDKRAEMTAQEMNDIAETLGLVMDKWMPMISKDFGAEFLLVSTFSMYGVRIMAMKKVLDEEKKVQKQFEKTLIKDDPEKPLASQLAINPDLKPQTGLYVSPTIGI